MYALAVAWNQCANENLGEVGDGRKGCNRPPPDSRINEKIYTGKDSAHIGVML